MRVKPGATVEETIRLLTTEQKKALNRVTHARERESEVIGETREEVRIALEKNVPARVIADRIGVSLARVYQIRDEARAALQQEDSSGA